MPDRDTALLEKLREQIAAADERALEARPYVEREWRGADKLIIRSTADATEVRYLVRAPVARSWEFTFGPDLTAEELHGWLSTLKQ